MKNMLVDMLTAMIPPETFEELKRVSVLCADAFDLIKHDHELLHAYSAVLNNHTVALINIDRALIAIMTHLEIKPPERLTPEMIEQGARSETPLN